MSEPQQSFKEPPKGVKVTGLESEPPQSFKEIPEGAVLEPPKSFKEIPEGIKLEDDLSIDEIKKMQSEGVKLSDKLQRKLFKAEDERGLIDQASGVIGSIPSGLVQIGSDYILGGAELANKALIQPLLLTVGDTTNNTEKAQKVLKEKDNALRSFVIGAAQDVEETANAAIRAVMFGTSATDKLFGKSEEERFRAWQERESMREQERQSIEENPDRAAYLLSQNPLIQGYVENEAKKMGLSPEEVEKVKQDYIQSMLDQGLKKEDISERIAAFGELRSPLDIPGIGTIGKLGTKLTGKALSKIASPVTKAVGNLPARAIEKTAGAIELSANKVLKGVELSQTAAKKIGEYTINDPDTWIKGTVNTAVLPVVAVAKPTAAVARVVKDIARQVDAGGTAGKRGLLERAGGDALSSNWTKGALGTEGKGGVARARAADWLIRQSNAMIQPGVSAGTLNVLMGLPDIETPEQLGYSFGTGLGVGGIGGLRAEERIGGLVDPRTTMAEKITNLVTPDPAAYRRDEDADIKRFVAQASPEVLQNIADLSNIEKRKAAIDANIANLTRDRDAQIDPEDAAFKQMQIDGYEKQKKALEKATPETQAEALRQTQLAFIDAYDLAQSSGGIAGLRGVNIAVLDPNNAEQFFRNLYGDSLKQAENTINVLTGIPSLTETDSQKLVEARQLLAKFQTDVNGAKNARGFALQEDVTDPESTDFVPPHLRRINQQGATAVINGDLIKQMTSGGFNVRHVLMHEVQHAVQQFSEVKKMLMPIRGQLFDQKIKNDDGTTEVYQQGIFSDEDLDRYATQYAKLISPSDNGASFYEQFGGSVDKMRSYIKDEILAEAAAVGGEYAGGTRASLDDVGRNVMDWLEVKTKSGRLKGLKETLRKNGIIFDNAGGYSTVLGAKLTPESLAMMRQYQRGLKDFDGTMTIQQSRESDEPDIPLTKVLGSVALQNKYRHADFFEKEQVIRATAPDGTVTEIPVPQGAKIDPFIDVYRTQNGQLVDANGNVVTLGPEITFGSMPDGTTFETDTRIARKSNGTPIILTNREMKSRARDRTAMIQNAIDSAKDDGSGVRLSDTGNGNYRGVMSPAQIEAFMLLPNEVVSPNLKRMTKKFNELMAKNDGTRIMMEYQASLLNGKYKALSPKIRDEVPIGFQLTRDGNFALTTISVSRLYDKMQAWADKKPMNLQAWGGDTNKFWDSVLQYLDNHAKGVKGETGLHPDPYIAGRMKNRINDLFNAYNAETKESNPERSTLPRARGKDNLDTVIRSRRLDRINNFTESPSTKIPINYGYLTTNYMPAANPMAAPMTAEEVQNRFDGSVTATRVRRAMATGEIDALETELRQMDDLLPTESLQLVQAEGEMPKIQIVSMFDPENIPSLEPDEIPTDIDAETEAELAILDAQDGSIPPQDVAKVLSSKLDQLYADGGRSPIIPALESELEKIYQQLEAQAQEQEAATEDVTEAPETTEVDAMNSPMDLLKQVVDDYNSGNAGDGQTLAQYIREAANSAGNLQIPEGITDEQIELAAKDYKQYRDSLKQRIRSGTAFSNAVVAPPGLQFLPAFHASKSDINKFDLDFVNTGIKSQVYGWGLYFAENKNELDTFYKSLPNRYKVDLDIDEKNILDWDAAPDARLTDEIEKLSNDIENDTGFKAKIYSVADYYEALSEYLGDAKLASMKLKEIGFDGIKYTDQITRASQKKSVNVDELIALPKTYNYVIFDDSKIKILEKNGQSAGSITQFMPAVQVIPERFTGTGEKGEERRGRYVAPPEFWTKFDIDEFERGGKFFDLETGEDVTDKTYATGTIDVTGRRPSLISESSIDEMPEGKGRTWKTNLFRKSAGWNWISEKPPEIAAIGTKEKPDPVLISVESGTDHFYALKTEFPDGVKLARYPEQGNEPRLRPTKKGQIQLGNEVGRIKTSRGKEHTVYDTITIGAKFMPSENDLALSNAPIPDVVVKGTGEFAVLRQALQGVEAPVRESAKISEIPKQAEAKQEIPVAKTETDAEEEVADTELRSTGIDVPEYVDEQSVISNAIKVANSQSWRKGRDFKMDMQRRVTEAAEKAGVTISERNAEAIEYLARVGLKDALIALEQNPNAIGWYDEKTKQALGVMSLLFPEIATDENARFAFTWALAVTSNGLKVDKNFELAERVYRQYRKTGKMPTNIEAGQAQKAINEGLDLFNKLTKEWGMENTRKFMQTDFTVGEISRLSKDLSPGGEFSDTNVRGSAILGPKIGNGFFSNLYGLFDALTMDRWLVRTWGRWTGTLVELNPELTKQATDRLQDAVQKLTPEDKTRMNEMIKQDISQMSLEDLSVAIQKASMKPELRDVMNKTETGEEFRKSGNGLAKYLDGQKEAPSGPSERNFIREIFGLMLDDLKSDPKYSGLTMADLQAVLWYAEKRLYETAKVKADQDNLDSSDADGYEDDEAPDYANAAIGVAREKGVSQKRIDEVLEKIKNDRTTITRPEVEEGDSDQTGQQKSAGGFTGKEKQEFRQYVAVTTARRNRVGNEKVLWTYARRSGGDGSNTGILKPKSKKNLGVKYISEWKPGRKLATMFRNNGLPPVKFLELDSTDKASAQKFADTLQQSKDQSKFGAAVYVYPVKDYQGMKLFISESGKSGFAIKPDGDIISVFSMEKGSGRSIMEAAIAAGGKKLDAFDTVLPKFYGTHGFVEAARIPWNDEYSPEGWDKQTFQKYNNGEPDVVMMVLDPKFEGEYEPRTDIYATDYDQAVEMQDSILKKLNKGSKKK